MLNYRQAFIIAIGISTPYAVAQDNDCKASVVFYKKHPAGSGTAFEFTVRTECKRSIGSFEYSYRDLRAEKRVNRSSAQWNDMTGGPFKFSDELSLPPEEVTDIEVTAGSVRSQEVK